MLEDINNQIKALSFEDKFRLFHKIALIKVDKFLDQKHNISSRLKNTLESLLHY